MRQGKLGRWGGLCFGRPTQPGYAAAPCIRLVVACNGAVLVEALIHQVRLALMRHESPFKRLSLDAA